MSNSGVKFLQCWLGRYVQGHSRHPENIDHTVAECISDASLKGVTKEDLEKAAGGDLRGYLLVKLKKEKGG